MKGRVVLVTGGGRRIGRAIAVSLAKEGADIILHVHTTSGEEVIRTIESFGQRAVLLRADISTPESAIRLGKEALQIFGRVDVLVNNAAVFFPTPLSQITSSSWKFILQTNMTAPFFLALILGLSMKKKGEGKIIQLGDWSGTRPSLDYLPYCVSKSGVVSCTLALAKVLAPYVQVNTIAPGPVLPPEQYDSEKRRKLVEQTPLQKLGDKMDIIRAVQFLVRSGDFVTGSTYLVDGGWFAKAAVGRDTSL